MGTIGIVDGDCVDLTNLQRQIIHDMDSLGVEKKRSRQESVFGKLNPDVKLHLHAERVTPENIMALIEPYDFIIDAVDNFSAKFLINDACVLAKKPFCHAGIRQFTDRFLRMCRGGTVLSVYFRRNSKRWNSGQLFFRRGYWFDSGNYWKYSGLGSAKIYYRGRRTSYRENAYLRWTDDEISDGEFWKSSNT